ncbi:hemolysin-III related [Symmachiella dynata]|uniref:Hemolysin-III related n=1 Tax=Symmachiella dynata TaxID=2527995 RepID=A0A517ZK42_9PLAN|nr:hemolysin III family protein [Symmachiella dynata]QDU42845.1 hemolysin-III related [Symmachiella dynata]
MRNSLKSLAGEEFANFLTHGGGLLFALVGAAVLVHAVADSPNEALKLGCWVYAAALIAVYAASTLSHTFIDPARRSFFRSLDQGVIFLFIAGNFTPFAIAYLHGSMLWILLSLMWVGASIGFASKVFWTHRVESTAVTHYLALGWLPVIAIEPILRALPASGIFWCIAGGVCYTVGTVVLTYDTKVPYFHALWHLLVIAGSFCHFLVVMGCVNSTPA